MYFWIWRGLETSERHFENIPVVVYSSLINHLNIIFYRWIIFITILIIIDVYWHQKWSKNPQGHRWDSVLSVQGVTAKWKQAAPQGHTEPLCSSSPHAGCADCHPEAMGMAAILIAPSSQVPQKSYVNLVFGTHFLGSLPSVWQTQQKHSVWSAQ